MNGLTTPAKAPPPESPKSIGIGFLIVLVMFVVVGGIIHYSEDPASSPPTTNPAPTQSNRRADIPPQRGSQPPLPAKVQPASHKHARTPELTKLERETAMTQAALDKRFPTEEQRQLYAEFMQQQQAVQTLIHLDYINLPPATTAEENMQRSAEEGQKVMDAQGKAYDQFCADHRLTEDQMTALFQEAQDNNWGK